MLAGVLGILEDSDSEGFQNVTVNIFDMVLEEALMFLPNYLPQLKANLFLKVESLVCTQLHIPWRVYTIYICPIPELIHGYIFCRA